MIERILSSTGVFYALGYFCSVLVLEKCHGSRLSVWRGFLLRSLFLVSLLGFMWVSSGVEGLLFFFSMLLIVTGILVMARVLVGFRREELVFQTMKAFLTGELMASGCWQVLYHLRFLPGPWRLFLLGALFLAGSALGYLIESCIFRDMDGLDLSWREDLMLGAIVLTVYVVSNLGFLDLGPLFEGRLVADTYLIRTLVDFSGVVMAHGYEILLKDARLALERDALQKLTQLQYQSYQISRENIEIVNEKYHDLKHQIQALREEGGSEETARALKRLEDEVKDYEGIVHSQNRYLDAILTAKKIQCEKSGIDLRLMVDGESLSFLEKMDLCALFGNLMDNAIEATSKEKGQKIIRLQVMREGSFVRIWEENSCAMPVDCQDGLPRTSKRDKNLHGFGMKSMKRTAERYQGSFLTQWERGYFRVMILLQVPEDGQKEPSRKESVATGRWKRGQGEERS